MCVLEYQFLIKICYEIPSLIPTSFNKFLETGNFEKKTNSVQCIVQILIYSSPGTLGTIFHGFDTIEPKGSLQLNAK